MGDKRLSETIDMKEFVKDKTPVIISAGVGAGKNYWVENKLSEYGSILLITSRRQIVDEVNDRNKDSFGNGQYDWYWGDGKKNRAITHSKLYQLIRSHRNIEDLFLDEQYDYIIVDEAHSMISDATFTDSAFHLLYFIANFRYKAKKRMILMSGTSEIFKNELINGLGFKHMDRMKECINIKPKVIQVINKTEAIKIMQSATEDNKMVYLSCSAKNISSKLVSDITKKGKIKKNNIKLVMSEQSAKKHKVDYSIIKSTIQYLATQQTLTDDTFVLLTTSKLKEGVNIKDSNIKTAFCESHNAVDLIQFSGRIRNGLDTLYIVDDARQYPNDYKEFEYSYCKNKERNLASNCLKEYIEKNNSIFKFKGDPNHKDDIIGNSFNMNAYLLDDNCKNLIDLIEEKWKFIRFEYFSAEFRIYEQRRHAIDEHKRNMKAYDKNYLEYLNKVFNVEEDTTDVVDNKIILNRYFKQNNLINKVLTEEEQDKILDELTEKGFISRSGKYSSLGKLLTKYPYTLKITGKSSNKKRKLVISKK